MQWYRTATNEVWCGRVLPYQRRIAATYAHLVPGCATCIPPDQPAIGSSAWVLWVHRSRCGMAGLARVLASWAGCACPAPALSWPHRSCLTNAKHAGCTGPKPPPHAKHVRTGPPVAASHPNSTLLLHGTGLGRDCRTRSLTDMRRALHPTTHATPGHARPPSEPRHAASPERPTSSSRLRYTIDDLCRIGVRWCEGRRRPDESATCVWRATSTARSRALATWANTDLQRSMNHRLTRCREREGPGKAAIPATDPRAPPPNSLPNPQLAQCPTSGSTRGGWGAQSPSDLSQRGPLIPSISTRAIFPSRAPMHLTRLGLDAWALKPARKRMIHEAEQPSTARTKPSTGRPFLPTSRRKQGRDPWAPHS